MSNEMSREKLKAVLVEHMAGFDGYDQTDAGHLANEFLARAAIGSPEQTTYTSERWSMTVVLGRTGRWRLIEVERKRAEHRIVEDTTYNGWVNWSTWIINHVFGNSETLVRAQEKLRRSHARRAAGGEPLTADEVKRLVLRNLAEVSLMSEMSSDELGQVEWAELAESWSDDWYNTGRPLYPSPEPEPADPDDFVYRVCPICMKNTYPPGRVVARCDECIERWEESERKRRQGERNEQ